MSSLADRLRHKLNIQILEIMRQCIDTVISGAEDSVRIPFVRPNDVLEHMKTVHGCGDRKWDTNGWEWDYWFYFDVKGTRYCLAGDGYFKNYTLFSKYNDETDEFCDDGEDD